MALLIAEIQITSNAIKQSIMERTAQTMEFTTTLLHQRKTAPRVTIVAKLVQVQDQTIASPANGERLICSLQAQIQLRSDRASKAVLKTSASSIKTTT